MVHSINSEKANKDKVDILIFHSYLDLMDTKQCNSPSKKMCYDSNSKLWNFGFLSGKMLAVFYLILPVFFTSSLVMCQRTVLEEDFPRVPTTRLSEDKGVYIFSGRGDEEHFNGQVVISDDYILVGARDVLYNISIVDMKEFKRFEWHSGEDVVEFCKNRDVPKDKCHNYMKVVLEKSALKSTSNKEFLICGTNSFKPTCKSLKIDQDSGEYQLINEMDGRAISPADPDHNSTSIHSDSKLFSATAFSRDSLIFSSPLRTQQQNSLVLNDPNFVGSMSYEGMIYFFFRETAIENINCGKAVFSRVARVCPNDKGGHLIMKNAWTTFFKSRLNCSMPGEFPFYFDEIQSISDLGHGNVHSTPMNESSQIIYAVFNTPRNSLRGSAVCAFKMSDVVKSFQGRFKDRMNDFSIWLTANNVPEPHPAATCPNDSLSLPDQTLNFIKTHPLMDMAVPAYGGRPALVQSSFKYGLTQVAIDWHMLAADRHYYDIIFTGTDDGRVLKTFNAGKGHEISPRLIEILTLGPSEPVRGLKVITDQASNQKKLLIITKDQVILTPLHRCGTAKTCRSCMALKDPYCSWMSNKCAHSQAGLQSLETGRHSKCPYEADDIEAKPSCQLCQCVVPHKSEILDGSKDGEQLTTPFGYATSASNDLESVANFDHLVYPGTCISGGEDCTSTVRNQVALAVLLSVVISLVIGFIVGLCFTQRRKVYAYGLTRINSLRNQVMKTKDFVDDGQTKSENYYETGPPSSTSSHRPIIPSQYWIKNRFCPQNGSDLMKRRDPLPSNSSSLTFVSPTFPPSDDPPTPPPITKLPLKLNFFNFLKDGSPSTNIHQKGKAVLLDENVELTKAEADAVFPFIDGIPESTESTFHDLFDVTPTTPVNFITADVSNTNKPKQKNSFIHQIRRNSFISNSISKVRSLLGNEAHL